MTELLTESEKALIDQLGKCYGAFTRIVGEGPTRSADITEFCTIIHAAQNTVMSQAAARAYPDTYRLLGDLVSKHQSAPIVFDDGPDFDPMHPPIDLLGPGDTDPPWLTRKETRL
jgi:hypothetical protein